MKTGARGAFFYFDCLRFVAALVVAIARTRDLLLRYHADIGAVGPGRKAFCAITIFGHADVMEYLMRSGLWISKTVDRRIDGSPFWADYLADGLSRLLLMLVAVA